ncbi:MAG: lipid-A-disaccharide synthase [Sediminibacterium sp.]|nr:lipid-A-disaccharide synthase [Sediminibacterium sp.]
MKYFFICGEASGDLHAANCIRAIKELDPGAVFAYTGGKHCETATGIKPVVHINEMAFMGFVEVVKNAGAIRRNFKTIKRAVLNFSPDALVLVDYPGFNLRMAKWAKERGLNVYYYISPTVWAWKENRVNTIRDYTDRMFVILPFEKAFYARHAIDVEFVGHPLLDAIEQETRLLPERATFLETHGLSEKPIIAVLPGSRKQEVERMLEIMLNVMPDFPDYQFVIACAPTFPEAYYKAIRERGVKTVSNATYPLLKYARAGIIKSGTSTLEAALFKLPQVVCYKAGAVTFAIAKRLVNVKYISLINLIMDKPVVKELIQQEMNAEQITKELHCLLEDASYRDAMIADYERAYERLGGAGASKRLAQGIINHLNQKN